MGRQRTAGLAGIAAVILVVVGFFVSYSGSPDTSSAPAKLVAYYGDSGHRDKIAVGWILVSLGMLAFLIFLAGLRQAMRTIDGEGFRTTLATLGGVIYTALMLASIAINTGIRTMSDDTYHHQVFPELIHAADDASYLVMAGAGVGIGVLMVVVSHAFLHAGRVPVWAGWIGVVLGVLAVASIFFIPLFGIALWVLVAGGLLASSGGREPAAPAVA